MLKDEIKKIKSQKNLKWKIAIKKIWFKVEIKNKLKGNNK